MARLHEYKGKEILRDNKIPVPEGRAAATPEEAEEIAGDLGKPAVVKMQAWITGRASVGGIQFVGTADEARSISKEILGRTVNNYEVEKVLVEEQLDIDREFYAGVVIDDAASKPVMIFSSRGGSGIEEIAEKYPDSVARKHISLEKGLKDYEARNLIRKTGISGKLQLKLGGLLVKLWNVAQKYETRSAEINPIVLTTGGDIYAADCRITIDDYAVFRHPELEIEVAREFDRPPTRLDRIAYNVEEGDYRGTFYFIQMEEDFEKGEGYIGFHGAGGGGSMMSMDAVMRKGFKIANFCDTSGNPPASKVYRAAKIILSQDNIDAYFGSGSGVASQEQYHSARGLVKAFREENLSVPCVIRLGGNLEDLAVEILENYTRDLPAPVEGYKKDDTADFCAGRLESLVEDYKYKPKDKIKREPPEDVYSFETMTGEIYYDHEACRECESKVCVEKCVPEILELEDGVPVLAIEREEAKGGKCIECLACEVECVMQGNSGGYIELPIEGLEE